jgi:glutathione peroxidase
MEENRQRKTTRCNQFLNQEPESDETMVSACNINFRVTFLLSKKIDVHGKNTHPVFVYLKKALPDGILGNRIKWNFTKFLVTAEGKPYKRYAPIHSSPNYLRKKRR